MVNKIKHLTVDEDTFWLVKEDMAKLKLYKYEDYIKHLRTNQTEP